MSVSFLPNIDERLSSELSSLAEQVLTSTGATGVAILMPDDSTGFICRAAVGVMAQDIGARVDGESGITGHCVRSRGIVCCEDANTDDRVNAEASRQLDIRSVIAAPLLDGNQIVGIIEAFSNTPNAFGVEQKATFQNFADVAGQLIAGCARGDDGVSAAFQQGSVQRYANDGECVSACRKATAHLTSNSEQLSPVPIAGRWWGKTRVIAIAILATFGLLSLTSANLRDRWRTLVAITPAEAVPVGSAVRDLSSLPLVPVAASLVEITAAPRDGWSDQLQREAEAGDAEAQVHLADAWANGQGVPVDRVKAYTWYIAAGLAGYPLSNQAMRELTRSLTRAELAKVRFSIGQMFLKGVGMPRDYVSAYCWLVLANAAGDPQAEIELTKLKERMSPQDVQEATDRASAWLARHNEPAR